MGDFEAGIADGIEQGRELNIISQVCKKLKKGKKPEEITEALEEDLSRIEQICRVEQECGEKCTPKEILDRVKEEQKK